MKSLSRRDFVKGAALGAAATLTSSNHALAASSTSADGLRASTADGPPRLHWLDGSIPDSHPGATWGVPWPKGIHSRDTRFTLRAPSGADVPLQTWPTAWWPDGSLKWTAHAVPAQAARVEDLALVVGSPAAPRHPVEATETPDEFVLHNGIVECRVPRSGDVLVRSLSRAGRETLVRGRLVGSFGGQPDGDTHPPSQPFTGRTEAVVLEQSGPVRATIKITGRHVTASGRAWLPFTIRIHLYADADAIRLIHTFVFDGDEDRDFIRSLGVSFEVPLTDEPHDRHVRFVGQDSGIWGEAVRGLTGLRRDPGEAVRKAQIEGIATPAVDTWDRRVSGRLRLIPAWADFSLAQLSANAFTIRKRTKTGHCWIDVDQGGRSPGVGYVGGASGGVAFGMRDFWRLHPTALDIRGAAGDAATVTLWMWSPEAPAMDLRFYHDGLGMDTYPEQLEGLEITYEDYEPGYGTPQGVARTTEIELHALAATPSRPALAAIATAIDRPPLLAARVEDYLHAGVFGRLWSPVDRSTPERAAIEDRLAWSIDYHRDQVDQRHWYGFWNYGDVMHAYDSDRHVWRYDVGGYAWDNSELSPDLWLWYSYLRTGRSDVFRLAEAMTRHTRDVDIYHAGRFAGLGSRHNVLHWGCSAKQLRISTAAYRRFHYFLTADERTGDVLDEVVEADRQLAIFNPVRKLPGQQHRAATPHIGVGTDWGSAAANWLTAWERTGDERYGSWLRESMRVIGEAPLGFFTAAFVFDPETKRLSTPASARVSVSHLSAVFGLVEMCAELTDLVEDPAFEAAWLRYCELYNAPAEVQREALGQPLRGTNLRVAHSRLTARVAVARNDAALARRAWSEFRLREWGPTPTLQTRKLVGPDVLNPVDEAAWVSTNDAAQWGLAAIQNLALIGTFLDAGD
ncbi:Tat pathway signal sequence domain protein [Opitutales bacterium ASA1]|uniref:exo-rhamnogalacturonan lyase family protein n=1 Tax=Congregicoccus parvus TaxID=3081749 RepID=UPI002B2B75E3|nr:Tat pathway signal sequence domain protein [Opitutales bacterium ASA1]